MIEGWITAVLVLRQPWPPETPALILQKNKDDQECLLRAYPDGHIAFIVQESNKCLVETHFQRIEVVGEAWSSIIISWKDGKVQLRINGNPLDEYEITKDTYIVKGGASVVERIEEISLPESNIVNDDLEKLFIETLRDIKEKLLNGSKYSLIKASGLLRHLLVDSDPLVHQVNRKYGMRLEFETVDFTRPFPVKSEIRWQNLDPSPFPKAKKLKLKLDGFLAATTLTIDNDHYSIREMIKMCAHLKGGVHSGKPKDDKESTFIKYEADFKVFEQDSSLMALKGILSIVLVGLEPLVHQMRDKKS